MTGKAAIRVGVGGWTFAPWRGVFYPKGLTQKRELAYASTHLTSIEINGTYYGAQKPESFAKWHDETPEGFVFALKGSRYTTNRRVLAEAGESVERFMTGGLLELKDKLGPINWQFMATKVFDPVDFEAFLKLLPKSVEGRAIRHAVEVRHASFQSPDFVALARAYDVAVVLAGDAKFPQIADLTASFSYLRLMGSHEDAPKGYSEAELSAWAKRVQMLEKGQVPPELQHWGAPAEARTQRRDVFVYFISGYKLLNPAAAMGLMAGLEN